MAAQGAGVAALPEERPDRPSFGWRLLLALLVRLPQGALSRGVGRLASIPLPEPVRAPILGLFARAVGVRVDEAAFPLRSYPSLNHFFVRTLRAGVRRWPEDPDTLGSPVDGVVGAFGRVSSGRALQAKGRSYSISGMLADEQALARYEGGSFLTIYLSPRHYHRIHAPLSAEIREARHVAGELVPVNLPAIQHLPEVFARNERLIATFERAGHRMALVAVGATNVGAISTRFDPAWGGPLPGGGAEPGDSGVPGRDPSEGDARADGEARVRALHPPAPVTNRGASAPPLPAHRTYAPPIAVEAGSEVMAFHLGSTVVMIFEPGVFELSPDLRQGREIRLGEPIARLRPRPSSSTG